MNVTSTVPLLSRQKGTANKATARLRESFTELLEDNMGQSARTLSIKWQRRILRKHYNYS